MTDLPAFCPRACNALLLARPLLRRILQDDAEAALEFDGRSLTNLLASAIRYGLGNDVTSTLDALFEAEAIVGVCPEQDDFTETLDRWRAEWPALRAALAEAGTQTTQQEVSP